MNFNFLLRQREFLTTGGVALAGILIMAYLPESTRLSPVVQSVIVSLGAFLVLPILYCKMILKRPLADLGFQGGSMIAGVGGGLIAIVSGLALLFGLLYFTPLLDDFRLPPLVEKSFLAFLLYEVALNGWITFLFEVFFRGLVMLLWFRAFGLWAIFVQAALFGTVVLISGGVTPQLIPFLLFSPLAGLVAYQSRSLYASWGASWFFIFLVDVIFLLVR